MCYVPPSIAPRFWLLVLVVALTLGGVSAAPPASAADHPFRTFVPLTRTAPPAPAAPFLRVMLDSRGEYIGQGQQYSYTEHDAVFSAVMMDPGFFSMSVQAANGDRWDVELAAPLGQALGVGVYDGAVRSMNRDYDTPGIAVRGNGRACDAFDGRFVIHELHTGAYEHVERLRATFEQRCPEAGTTAPLLGEIEFTNPVPPPLRVGFDIVGQGTINPATGAATVRGSVACNRQMDLALDLRVTQGEQEAGTNLGTVRCAVTPQVWTATLHPSTTGFAEGISEVVLTGVAYDPEYQTTVSASATKVVQFAAAP